MLKNIRIIANDTHVLMALWFPNGNVCTDYYGEIKVKVCDKDCFKSQCFVNYSDYLSDMKSLLLHTSYSFQKVCYDFQYKSPSTKIVLLCVRIFVHYIQNKLEINVYIVQLKWTVFGVTGAPGTRVRSLAGVDRRWGTERVTFRKEWTMGGTVPDRNMKLINAPAIFVQVVKNACKRLHKLLLINGCLKCRGKHFLC